MKTEIIKIDQKNPDKTAIKKAAGIIKKGGLVAFPTETVYGLAADYLNKKAIEKLCDVKKRPKNKPFTIHIASVDELVNLSCEVSFFSEKLIEKFWPGPLTLIFNTKSGKKTGIRMPDNRAALEFISACGTPVIAPSANISGRASPHNAEDVLSDLGGMIDLVLDGGRVDIGVESTVIDMSALPYRIIREGAINKSRIADVGRAFAQSGYQMSSQ
ncbi:MAG: L-threonylcarbamoyladenylate synthase [Candidatus Omnitrophota bacterium]|nr:L-threonylcarbamoyladenylate synthase [Candidatus Omnitrophota bacterium]